MALPTTAPAVPAPQSFPSIAPQGLFPAIGNQDPQFGTYPGEQDFLGTAVTPPGNPWPAIRTDLTPLLQSRDVATANAVIPGLLDPNANTTQWTPEMAAAQTDSAIAKIGTSNPELASQLEAQRTNNAVPNTSGGFWDTVKHAVGSFMGLPGVAQAFDWLSRPAKIVPELLDDQEHQSFWGNVGQALSGNSQASWSRVIEDKGPQWMADNPVIKGVAGFIGDVASDPLTYLTFGLEGVGRSVVARGAAELGFTGSVLAEEGLSPMVKGITKSLSEQFGREVAPKEAVQTLWNHITTAGLDETSAAGVLGYSLQQGDRELLLQAGKSADNLHKIASLGGLSKLTPEVASQYGIPLDTVKGLIEDKRLAGAFGNKAAYEEAKSATALEGGVRFRFSVPFTDFRYISKPLWLSQGMDFGMARRFFAGMSGEARLAKAITTGSEVLGGPEAASTVLSNWLSGGWKALEADPMTADAAKALGQGLGGANGMMYSLSESIGQLTAHFSPSAKVLRGGGFGMQLFSDARKGATSWTKSFDNASWTIKEATTDAAGQAATRIWNPHEVQQFIFDNTPRDAKWWDEHGVNYLEGVPTELAGRDPGAYYDGLRQQVYGQVDAGTLSEEAATKKLDELTRRQNQAETALDGMSADQQKAMDFVRTAVGQSRDGVMEHGRYVPDTMHDLNGTVALREDQMYLHTEGSSPLAEGQWFLDDSSAPVKMDTVGGWHTTSVPLKADDPTAPFVHGIRTVDGETAKAKGLTQQVGVRALHPLEVFEDDSKAVIGNDPALQTMTGLQKAQGIHERLAPQIDQVQSNLTTDLVRGEIADQRQTTLSRFVTESLKQAEDGGYDSVVIHRADGTSELVPFSAKQVKLQDAMAPTLHPNRAYFPRVITNQALEATQGVISPAELKIIGGMSKFHHDMLRAYPELPLQEAEARIIDDLANGVAPGTKTALPHSLKLPKGFQLFERNPLKAATKYVDRSGDIVKQTLLGRVYQTAAGMGWVTHAPSASAPIGTTISHYNLVPKKVMALMGLDETAQEAALTVAKQQSSVASDLQATGRELETVLAKAHSDLQDLWDSWDYAPMQATDGSPLRVFHGTSNVFDTPTVDKGLQGETNLVGPGHYVTDSGEVASSYAENRGSLGQAWASIPSPAASEEEALSRAKAALKRREPDQEYILSANQVAPGKYNVDAMRVTPENVRGSYVKRGSNILNMDSPMDVDTARQWAVAAENAGNTKVAASLRKYVDAGGSQNTVGEIYHALTSEEGKSYGFIDRGVASKTELNDILHRGGYDGIEYEGGKFVGGLGKHRAFNIFDPKQTLMPGFAPPVQFERLGEMARAGHDTTLKGEELIKTYQDSLAALRDVDARIKDLRASKDTTPTELKALADRQQTLTAQLRDQYDLMNKTPSTAPRPHQPEELTRAKLLAKQRDLDTHTRKLQDAISEVNKIKARAHAEGSEAQVQSWLVPAEEAKTGMRPIQLGELKGLWAPEYLAQEWEKQVLGHEFGAARAHFRKFQSWWKDYATYLFPGFHIRNAMGAYFNNWLGGVANADYVIAGRVRRAAHDMDNVPPAEWTWANKEVDRAFLQEHHLEQYFGKKVTYADLANMTKQMGLDAAHGRTLAEARVGSENITKQLAAEPLRTKYAAGRVYDKSMRGAGELTENLFRTAAFMKGLRDTSGDLYGARAFTMLRHGDYQDLTDWEYGMVRDLIPFYKWMRTNTPYQIHQLLENPGKLLAITKAQQAGYTIQGEDYYKTMAVLPPWMRDQVTVPIHSGDAMSLLTLDLPMHDLFTSGGDFISKFLPLARPWFESYITKESLYTGKQLTGKAVPLAPWVSDIPGLTQLLEVSGAVTKNQAGQATITDQAQNLLSMIPAFSRFRNFIFEEPDRAGLRTGAVASAFFGAGLRPVDQQMMTGTELGFYYSQVLPQLEYMRSLGITLPDKSQIPDYAYWAQSLTPPDMQVGLPQAA